jgi:nitrogenase iron protein NifH
VIETLDELQVLQSGKFDVAVFDVLGDVVCGGFAAPLREGFARKLIIVLSEEPMALFAANNIARAVDIYQDNGVRLAGLVINLRSNNADLRPLEAFARRLGTTILGVIERDPRITEAERLHLTLLEYAPSAPSARVIEALANKLLAMDSDKLPVPSPMTDEEFFDFLRANGE